MTTSWRLKAGRTQRRFGDDPFHTPLLHMGTKLSLASLVRSEIGAVGPPGIIADLLADLGIVVHVPDQAVDDALTKPWSKQVSRIALLAASNGLANDGKK